MTYEDLADVSIRETDLSYERYNRGKAGRRFRLWRRGTEQVPAGPEGGRRLPGGRLRHDHSLYYQGCLVGFFTLCNEGLEIKYVETRKLPNRVTKRQKEIVRNIPAIKIGRFAVDRRLHGKGLGRAMMRFIVGYAMDQRDGVVAVRLLILQATPGAQPFYERMGFEFTIEKDRERGKRDRTMFLDLDGIADEANEGA